MIRWLAVSLLVFLCACAGGQSESPQDLSAPAGPGFASLPAPQDLPVRAASAVVSSLDGAQFAAEVAGPLRVTADGAAADYAPHWDLSAEPVAADLAWALYVFTLTDFEGGRWVCNSWTAPPVAGEMWLGLGDRAAGRWDWYQPLPDGFVDDRLLIEDLEPYLGAEDTLLAVVALTADGDYSLSRLWLEGEPPIASEVVQSDLAPGTLVTFSTDAGGDEPLIFSWDFGEGAEPGTSTDPEPEVTLGPAGIYLGSVNIENPLGGFQLDFQYESGVPTIESVEPEGGMAGSEVTFGALVSGDGELAYAWDFGGGADPDTSDEASPTVTLGAAGEYEASLTVTNDWGEDTFEFTLTIEGWPATLFIYPDPDDTDWDGVLGSGTEEDYYIVSDYDPPFNTDYQLCFSLKANSLADGSGVDIPVELLIWDAWPPFIVEDTSWSIPGTFQAESNGFTHGYIFATTPDVVVSNYLYVTSLVEL